MTRAGGGLRGLSVLLAGLLAAGSAGCGSVTRIPAPAGGGTVVSSDAALSLQRRADGFYLRLAQRRFNTLETYNDFILRDHFRTLDLFFDYYADLAQALDGAHFQRSRPSGVEVQEFLFEGEQTALVQVYFTGQDDRPVWSFMKLAIWPFFAPKGASHLRVDRWEFADGTWWIRPGKL